MASRQRRRLPSEICDLIIDIVAKSAFPTKGTDLFACSMVCRSWVHRSRIHIFSRVELEDQRKLERFQNALSRSPEVGRLVKTLMISPRMRSHFDRKVPSYQWLYEAMHTLPPFLTDLREVHFVHLPILHPVFMSLLSPFKTVESLHLSWLLKLQSFAEIVQIIRKFRGLRELKLNMCTWKAPSSYYKGKHLGITTLDVVGTSSANQDLLLDWMVASHSASTLAHLRWLDQSPHAASKLNGLLRTSAHTLQSAWISVGYEGTEGLHSFIHNTALRSLSFRTMPLKILLALLSGDHFAPRNVLETLVVQITERFEDALSAQSEADWKIIDTALCGPKFAKLVDLRLETSGRGALPINDVRAGFSKVLPKACQKIKLWWKDWGRDEFVHIPPNDTRRALNRSVP